MKNGKRNVTKIVIHKQTAHHQKFSVMGCRFESNINLYRYILPLELPQVASGGFAKGFSHFIINLKLEVEPTSSLRCKITRG